MKMSKAEWRFHKETNDAWYQCYERRCAIRQFKKAVRDALKPLYDFINRLLGD